MGSWTRQRAVGIAERLGAARYAEEDGLDRRAVHAVVSPPEGTITTLHEASKGFREAYDLARRQGIRGGAAIFHGYRATELTKQEYRKEDPDMGIWAWILQRPEDWRDLTYWSPHWHIIGLSRDFAENDPDSQDGWVAKRIRSMDRMDGLHDRDAHDDVVGLVRYLMSHATFEVNSSTDCVRWFGDLATCKFSAENELSDGVISVLERIVEEVVGPGDDRADDPAEPEKCDCCGGTSRSPIYDAGYALQDPGWCNRICEEYGRERERKLKIAFEWSIGELKPPPGLGAPTTEEEYEETFAALCD